MQKIGLYLPEEGGNIVALTQLFWPVVHPALQEERKMIFEHNIEIKRVSSQCGTPGHQDLVVTCSCGKLDQRIMHGDREDAQKATLYHRLTALEEVVGMKIKIEWAAGT